MSKEDFQSIIVDTEDVIKELKAVSSAYKIPINKIDFNILEVKTFFKTSENEEWEELGEDKKDMFESDEFLLHEELIVNQQFKIEIFELPKENKKQETLPNITLGANKTLTSILATIKKGLDLSTENGLDKKIVHEINKKKIRAGVLVNVCEKNMLKEVNRVASSIQVNGFLQKDESFVVMDCLKPIFSINDELIMHYQKKVKKEDEQGRIDYSRRGFILPVEENEVIIEYIKPQLGKPGRDCKGNYIPVDEPIESNQPNINVTDAISIKEDDKSIKYVALKKGYVKDDHGTYDIQDEMDIDGVKFKTTGSIEAGIDSNVTINIKQSGEFEDAIGAGMKVETTNVNIEGSVGRNATIKANNVTIGGQTHKNSSIECKNIEVTVHRGKIIANDIKIQRLEGGKVMGDIVHVDTVIGGTIIAREIYIENLMSNATLITSELIDIKHSKGTNNKLTVDPSRIKGLKSKIDSVSKKIKDAKNLCEQIPKQIAFKKETIDNNKEAVGIVKQRVLELKAKKIKPFVGLTKKLLDYQQLITQYNALIKEFKEKKEEIRNLQKELDEYQSKVFSAKIVNHSPWREFNEICFKLIYPPVEIIHNTRENEMSRVMTLEKSTDEDYQIQRLTEFQQ